MGLPCSDLRKTEWRKFNFEERKVRNQTEPIKFEMPFSYSEAPPGGSDGKESACHARDLGLIHELVRSPGEGKGYPLDSSGVFWPGEFHGLYSPQGHKVRHN